VTYNLIKRIMDTAEEKENDESVEDEEVIAEPVYKIRPHLYEK